MSFDKLSTETVSQILLNLPFEGMLAAERVCKTWKDVVDSDPNIQIQLFRRPTNKYVAPTAKSARRGWAVGDDGKTVRLHPAINSVSYMLGSKLDEVEFYTRNDNNIKLQSLSIAMHQFSIPSAQKIMVDAHDLLIHVKNDDGGVKVIDFFRELVEDSHIDDPELLGGDVWGHPFYEGIDSVRFSGGYVVGSISFGS